MGTEQNVRGEVERVAAPAVPAAGPLRERSPLPAAVLQSSPLPVLAVDREGRVLSWNPAAADLLGWPEQEVLGRLLPAVPESRREEFLAVTEAARQGQTIRGIEVRWRDRAGAALDVSLSAAPLRDAAGAVQGAVVTLAGVAQLHRAEEALRDSDRMFRSLFEGALDAMVIADDEGTYREANPAAAALFGLPRAQLVGRCVADFAEPGFDFRRAWAAFREQGRMQGAFRLVRADGTVRDVEYSATADVLPGRHLSVLRDVSERVRAEQRLGFLAEASEVLGSSLDYPITLASVARLVVPHLADWCSVRVLEPDGVLRQLAVAHADPARSEWARELDSRYPPDPEAPRGVWQVLRTGQSELAPEITDEDLARAARDPEHLRILRGLGLRSCMLVPLTARGRTLGAITFVSAESGHRYGPADLALAEDLAARAALAVDNARLYQDMQQALEQHRSAEEQLALLAEASGSLTSSLQLPAVLSAVLDLSRRLIAADAYAVWRRQPEDGQWVMVVSSGLSDDYRRTAGRITGPYQGMPEEPVVAEDVEHSGFLEARREGYLGEGVRSLLAVPLRVHGRVSGTLTFYYRRPHRFAQREVRVATALANLAGAAVGTAELYAEESRQRAEAEEARQRLAFLAEASSVLSSSLDYLTTLEHLARLAVPHFADCCAVYMLEEDGSVRHLAAAHADPARQALMHELHRRYPLPPDFPRGFRKVLRSGEPDLVEEVPDSLVAAAARDEEHRRMLRELGIVSNLSVPLLARGRVLGAISFGTTTSGRRYGPRDVALAEELARRAAVAIDNSQLYRAVKEADARKDEFLALLGHELRNPLAPLRNALQVLRLRAGGDPGVAPLGEMMERQVLHLARLVDDLLDVSRITRGKVELRKEGVDLAALAARTVEANRPLVDERGHGLTLTLGPGPVRVEADPTRLEQVLANLLSNAAKYTPPGGRVEVSVCREGAEAVVRVKDTGIGIRPELLPHVFEPFRQGDRVPGRVQEGLGLGLTLVRSLVELHGGTVAAASAGPDRGSEFTVRLPLLAEAEGWGVPAAVAGTSAPGRARGLRVLAVDDNADGADSLAVLLRLQGHEVRVAYDGPAALEVAREYGPEVVLLDIGLPRGMDGYEVARRLRAEPGAGPALLVALTGFGQEEDRRRSREAGFDHHLTKPVDPADLQRLLESWRPSSADGGQGPACEPGR